MAIIAKIRDAETGNVVDMALEPENTVEEAIESACSYWKKDPGAYVLRRGSALLRGRSKIVELAIHGGEVLELIPDPEGG